MDLSRFGLLCRPFRPSPDPAGYVPAATTEAALTGLHQALNRREGIVLLDGEAGLGKTLVALKFLEELDAPVPRVFVPAARFTRPADLFQTLLFDADVPYQGQPEHELRLAVTDQLLRGIASGPTVLVLDEAQHLSAEVLEELRLLGNLACRGAVALFVVLVAQPGLRTRLQPTDHHGLGQRVSTRFRLEPLTSDESAEYLTSHLRQAGAKPDLLTTEAIQILGLSCGGVPRVLNQAASLALALAAAGGELSADSEAVLDALEQLGLTAQDTATPEPMETRSESLPPTPRPARGGRRKSA